MKTYIVHVATETDWPTHGGERRTKNPHVVGSFVIYDHEPAAAAQQVRDDEQLMDDVSLVVTEAVAEFILTKGVRAVEA